MSYKADDLDLVIERLLENAMRGITPEKPRSTVPRLPKWAQIERPSQERAKAPIAFTPQAPKAPKVPEIQATRYPFLRKR